MFLSDLGLEGNVSISTIGFDAHKTKLLAAFHSFVNILEECEQKAWQDWIKEEVNELMGI
jgi:hypothetical protein